ncbi:MAG: protein kinase [Ktedonobacteraceae bacterium]|nr:protein kinase [Ktedonobacteraceae bacterium]
MSEMFSQYQVLSQLAGGTSSHVYLAASPTALGQQVVIKAFDTTRSNDPQSYARFLNEVETLKQFSHVHILPVLDAGIEKYRPYLVYPHAAHGSLVDVLRQGRPPLEQAVQILSQVGQALASAHERNILHGNIKPENILFNTPGEALLSDFMLASLSKQAGNKIDTRSACYMAPEQFTGGLYAASDQYALGCVAYELLTGRVPFSALAVSTLRNRHRREQPLPLRLFEPGLPEHIEAAILKAMAKEPGERHEDMLAFIAALVVGSLPQPSFAASSIPTQDLPPDLELQQSGIVQVSPVSDAAHSMPRLAATMTHAGPRPPMASDNTGMPGATMLPQTPVMEPLPRPAAEEAGGVPSMPTHPLLAGQSAHKPSRSKKLSIQVWAAVAVASLLVFSMVFVPLFLSQPQPDKKTQVPPATPSAMATTLTSPTVQSTVSGTVTPNASATQPVRSHPKPTPTATPKPAPTAMPPGTLISLSNSGFEKPDVGNSRSYAYSPSGASWSFSPQQGSDGAGLTGNNSSMSDGNTAPEGSQAAFLQARGSMSQAVNMPAGTYKVTFYCSQPFGSLGNQGLQVKLDGQVIFSGAPGDNYAQSSTKSFTVSAGSHTLTFLGTDTFSQSIALVDKVAIISQ